MSNKGLASDGEYWDWGRATVDNIEGQLYCPIRQSIRHLAAPADLIVGLKQ